MSVYSTTTDNVDSIFAVGRIVYRVVYSALNVQMSAMSKTVRQLVQFLEPLEDDFKCPICYEVLQEPHLTTCCGNHHICKGCMENVKRVNGRCPLCQQKPFDGFIDKRFERQLNDLKAYCIYESKGCKWIGNFGKIEQHLNTGKENGECQFVVVECPVSVECKEYFLRKNLKNHVSNVCKYRQVICIYCGFVSTYQNITSLHLEKCTKYPLFCPNKCSNQTYPRNQLSTHLASCPEQEVDCTFSEMGCKEKIKRRALQEHLDTNLLQHQLIMCQAFKEMKKDKQEVEEQLELLKKDKRELEAKMQDMLKLSNQEDNQIKSLKYIAKTNNHLQPAYFYKMAEFSDAHPMVPVVLKASFEITVTRQRNYSQRSSFRTVDHYTAQPYKSPFFYSYPNGYKLQLSAELICHCWNCREPQQEETTAIQSQQQQTYERQRADGVYDYYVGPSYYPGTVTSFAVNLYIFKGDHDSQLKWPFKEKVTITVYEYTHRKGLAADRRINSNYPAYIPHAVAMFEGNQNYTNTGSQLDIKQVIEKNEADLMQPPQMASQRSIFDIPQKYTQPKVRVLLEKGLLLPLDLQIHKAFEQNYRPRNETIYFEVTFSP